MAPWPDAESVNPGGRDPLAEVAGAVADGTPVDWTREKETVDAEVRKSLDDLSVIERVRAVHSALAPASPAPTSPARTSPAPTSPAPASPAPASEKTVTPPAQDPEATVQSPASISVWGHLRILELLGYGAWGEVYRAYDPTLQMEVALKLLKFEAQSEQNAQRFLSEARRLARVRHPNVVRVHGADQHDGRYGIWTELIRGQTLETYLSRQGILNAREATSIGLDLCRALSEVHAAGLIHRDIKASNVIREEGGRIVLMDFGSGVEVRPGTAVPMSRHIYGTPLVMAPEQLRGETAGPATDVYGLGVLLYWLVSGKYPVEGGTYEEIVRAHERRAYVPLRDRRGNLPLAFIQVVERAIAPEPAKRFASAGALEQTLAALMFPPPPRRVTWKQGISVLAPVTALIVLVWLHPWSPDGEDGKTPNPVPSAGSTQAPGSRRGPLTATASLRRLASKGEEILGPGSRIAPGEKISMRIEGPDSMYVYVLNEDRQGNVFLLFPIPGLLPENPLRPAVEHRLPGTMEDSLVYWNVTSAGDRETIVAVASRAPLPDWESAIRSFPKAERSHPIEYRPMKRQTLLRGLGGIAVEAPPKESSGRSLADVLKTLGQKTAGKDLWIWTAELENPRRP